jgi:hypothetical protein
MIASDSHKSPAILWNLNVRYSVDNSRPPVPFRQINPFYAPTLFLHDLFWYYPTIYL